MSDRILVRVPSFQEYVVEAASFCRFVEPPVRKKKPGIPEFGDSRVLLWQDSDYSSSSDLGQEDIFRAVEEGLIFPCTTAQISDALARQMGGEEQVLLAGKGYYDKHEHNYFCVFGRERRLAVAYVYQDRPLQRWEKHALNPEGSSRLSPIHRIFYNPPWRSVLGLG